MCSANGVFNHERLSDDTTRKGAPHRPFGEKSVLYPLPSFIYDPAYTVTSVKLSNMPDCARAKRTTPSSHDAVIAPSYLRDTRPTGHQRLPLLPPGLAESPQCAVEVVAHSGDVHSRKDREVTQLLAFGDPRSPLCMRRRVQAALTRSWSSRLDRTRRRAPLCANISQWSREAEFEPPPSSPHVDI